MSAYPRFSCYACARDYHALFNPVTCPHCGASLVVEDDEPDVELPLSFWYFTQARKDDAIDEAVDEIVFELQTLLAERDVYGSQDEEENLS